LMHAFSLDSVVYEKSYDSVWA